MVATAAALDLIQDTQHAQTRTEKIQSFQYFQKNFNEVMSNYGWVYGDQYNNFRTEKIMFNNMYSARASERFDRQWEERVNTPIWVYETAGDNRVRPDHRVLAGIARPATDGFWDFYYPPNGHNCRCKVNAISDGDITEFTTFNNNEIEWDGGQLGVQEKVDPRTGKTVKLWDGVQMGFQYDMRNYEEQLTMVLQRPSTLQIE